MANTTKNRLFYGDMGYNKTQGKTMPMLLGAFSFLRQPLSVIDLFRNVLRGFKKFYFEIKFKQKSPRNCMGLEVHYIVDYLKIKSKQLKCIHVFFTVFILFSIEYLHKFLCHEWVPKPMMYQSIY